MADHGRRDAVGGKMMQWGGEECLWLGAFGESSVAEVNDGNGNVSGRH